ncbi:hypothetical protein [Streptomyces sp. NPDC059786]|uniref:hypothetical protein n=1 Tax=Streptomyces sp. NPDC059786 TaxID=3346946 RepID=UPI003658B189
MFRVLVCCAALAAGPWVAASAAWAGGAGGLLSPALGNGCANDAGAVIARGAAAPGPHVAGGALVGLPLTGPVNQCGNADLPTGPVLAVPLQAVPVCKTLNNLGPLKSGRHALTAAAGFCG